MGWMDTYIGWMGHCLQIREEKDESFAIAIQYCCYVGDHGCRID